MSYWESEDLFLNGDQFFDQLIKDIEAAKESITVEMYIFNDDLLGRKMAAHLVAAQIRGVKVQVLWIVWGPRICMSAFPDYSQKEAYQLKPTTLCLFFTHSMGK